MSHTRTIGLTFAMLAITIGSYLAAALPAAAGGGGGCHEGTGVSDERGTTVTLIGNCFKATVTRVDEGATVTFFNRDPQAHTVTGTAFTWGSDDLLLEGDSVQHTFTESGVYVYSCLLHPGMAGAIVVGDGGPGPGTAGAVRSTRLQSSSDIGGDAVPPGQSATPHPQAEAAMVPVASCSRR
jgi:plastocyanin